MLTLANIKDWLKTFELFENYYIGKLDSKKDKSLGIYSLKRSAPPVVALGGLNNTTYNIKSVSVLIHYNRNADETEHVAQELYNKLLDTGKLLINNTQIYYINLLVPEPVDVGTDEYGIYERVIEFEIYYERI